MSEPVRGMVVAHGTLAQGLLDAVEEITGHTSGLIPVPNEGLTPGALEGRLEELTGEGPAIMFVDLPNGSCAYAARRLQRRSSGVAIVCGVNLPLLLDFVFHRESSLDDLVERLRCHVGVSIECNDDADRSVSGR